MQKREKILLAGAGVSALIFLFNQFVCSGKAPEPGADVKLSQVKATNVKKADVLLPLTDEELIKNRRLRWKTVVFTDWDRNPFAARASLLNIIDPYSAVDSSTAAADSAQAPVLNGLLWGVGEPVALIGDSILREGERDGDLQMLKIGPNYVICRKAGEVLRLELQGPFQPFQRKLSP
jgi:hypothetical protein